MDHTGQNAAQGPGGAGLDVEFTIRLGMLDLQVAFTVAAGETVALLGPNGAGKTTILRALAGLHAIDAGHIRLDDVALDDAAAGVHVPAEGRPIGVVFQDYLLFPNLTVLENVAFGLRSRGVPRSTARAAAGAWLERVGLGHTARSRARQLSGGQQQRVALARALAPSPRLLMLDEPLAALDVGTRNELRRELRRHLSALDTVRVLVTHDPLDAHALADRVLVIEAGRITHRGTLVEVAAHPRSRYVAELVGVNLLEGMLRGGALRLAGEAELISAASDVPDGPAFAAVHPHAVALHATRPHGSPRNTWPATVAELDHHANRVRVRLAGPVPLVAEITPAALAELDLHPGDPVWASVKATEITVYPA